MLSMSYFKIFANKAWQTNDDKSMKAHVNSKKRIGCCKEVFKVPEGKYEFYGKGQV